MYALRSSVAVVVATRNRAGLLRECLAALDAQTVAPAEIAVVDDASSDETPRVLRSFTGLGATLRTERNPRQRGPAASRNRGLANDDGADGGVHR
jgi:glycosyltransferase involved in cell wall biosynthesis